MSKPLTVKTLENIRPVAVRREIPDGHMPGLYFVVQPSGAVSWAVRYRHRGRSRKLTLGAYPALRLSEARDRAGEALRAVAQGRDPQSEKREMSRQRREGPPAGDLMPDVLELFLARHVRPNNRTAPEVERMLKRDVAPSWAERSIREITRRDVVELLDAIGERAPIMANRVHTNLRKCFAWCVERGVLSSNPMVGLKRPAIEESRDRILTDAEICLFWRATSGLGFPFGPMFRLLLVTGQRRDEVRNIKRSEIDFRNETWTIPKERVKNGRAQEVPLSSLAMDVISEIPILESNGSLLFSTTGRSAPTGYSNAKERVDAAMLGLVKEAALIEGQDPRELQIPNWRLHDLRRTAASGMARLGQPIHVVEAVLNHKSGTIRGVAAVYNRYSYADEKRSALKAWSSSLLGLLGE